MTAGDVVAIVIWCLPSAIAIWHGARQKGHALEWGLMCVVGNFVHNGGH